jgi:hypothetical protein
VARAKLEKLWIGGGAVAALVVAGAVWTFGVSPEFDNADAVRSQAVDTQTQNLALQSNVTRLQREYAGISKLRGQLTAAHEALPGDLAMSNFTQQIANQAKAAHVSVQTLTAGAPAALTSAPAPAATTGSSTAAPVPTTSSAPSIYTVAVSVTVSGKSADELRFLRSVQLDGPRAALLTGATSTGATSGNSGTLALQMTVFVAPTPVAPTPTATAATPTASPTSP